MKKKFALLLLFAVLFLTACSSKEQMGEKAEKNRLPKYEENLTWWGDRSKPFSNLEYPEISETEALDLIENKFELKVPEYYTQAKKIVEKNLVSKHVNWKDQYSIFSEDDNFVFTSFIQVNDSQNKPISYAKIELKYKYIALQKKVKLLSQELSLYNLATSEEFTGDHLMSIVEQISELLHLKDKDKLLTKFSEDTKSLAKDGGKEVVVVRKLDQSYQKKIFGQNFGVIFKNSDEVESIYSIISDERL